MVRRSTQFTCQSCGALTMKWSGKCDSCQQWNTIVEETAPAPRTAAASPKSGRAVPLVGLTGAGKEPDRVSTGIGEMDRVLGGGLVRGSAVLLGGEPGIGKSTLLIQACASMASSGHRVVYISGEEAIAQVRMRADRLGFADAPVLLAAETSVENILATLKDGGTPALVIIDSIQTLWTDTIDSAPGTVSQVRTSGQALISYAKTSGAGMIMVGHVTKDGSIAGPRVIEHMVDAVMYFEGDAAHQFRVMRAIKNRFGPTDEIGVFEMTGTGLNEVENPSALFMGDRTTEAPGTVIFAGMEGTRPMLVEIQALISPTALANPRRAVVGWDANRLSMIMAVLQSRCGINFGQSDVYLNVAGGLRIQEPAADLAVAAALVSSLSDISIGTDCVLFGEISLAGTTRPVAHGQTRLREARKLGFGSAWLPKGNQSDDAKGLSLKPVEHLADLVADITGKARTKSRQLDSRD